ncbi:hypothetical protein K474DRAFT_1700880 [Panus rudis PR-1116 ss-1]|nr:hypothetical protein K474DRAFT_1700880 [Panus rudis PR-1116 ss-1]
MATASCISQEEGRDDSGNTVQGWCSEEAEPGASTSPEVARRIQSFTVIRTHVRPSILVKEALLNGHSLDRNAEQDYMRWTDRSNLKSRSPKMLFGTVWQKLRSFLQIRLNFLRHFAHRDIALNNREHETTLPNELEPGAEGNVTATKTGGKKGYREKREYMYDVCKAKGADDATRKSWDSN